MFKILFQGDSLTDACRDKECKDVDTNKRLGVGYVNHVAAYLMTVNPEIRVKNNGVNGNRIVDLYARWTEDTLNEEFDLLGILCGVNDVGFQLRLNRGVETEKYRYIYDRMLYEAVSYTHLSDRHAPLFRGRKALLSDCLAGPVQQCARFQSPH